jgi:acylphosphatase
MKEVKVYISGLVQGVGFRYFVLRYAEQLGLKGYARNLSDGRVEVLAQGTEANLKFLLEYIKKGPAGAEVDLTEDFWQEELTGKLWEGFEVNG